MPYYLKINFQDTASSNALNSFFFLDSVNLMMFFIFLFILFFLFVLMSNNLSLIDLKENNKLEFYWTILPFIFIIFLMFPSCFFLYLVESESKYDKIFSVTGNQWYWNYKLKKFNMNSYIFPSVMNRNLSTDYSLYLPVMKNNKMIFTSNDVIHSWTIPCMMTKMDCVPGRLNSLMIKSMKSMKVKGQCSELCGSNHSFMPISVFIL